jgi:hypothetical protein
VLFFLCALCENNFVRFVVKAKRNHEGHEGKRKVRKANPCKLRSICVFRVRLKKGTQMRRIQRINTETTFNFVCLTSPCRCATSLSFHKERDVLATPKQGEVSSLCALCLKSKKPRRARRQAQSSQSQSVQTPFNLCVPCAIHLQIHARFVISATNFNIGKKSCADKP